MWLCTCCKYFNSKVYLKIRKMKQTCTTHIEAWINLADFNDIQTFPKEGKMVEGRQDDGQVTIRRQSGVGQISKVFWAWHGQTWNLSTLLQDCHRLMTFWQIYRFASYFLHLYFFGSWYFLGKYSFWRLNIFRRPNIFGNQIFYYFLRKKYFLT